jgi:hypothetical protein
MSRCNSGFLTCKTALRGQRLTGGRFPSGGWCASGAAVGGDCEAIASGLKEKEVSHAKTEAILANYSLQTEPRRLRREVSTAAGATVRGGSQPRALGRALPAQGGLVWHFTAWPFENLLTG